MRYITENKKGYVLHSYKKEFKPGSFSPVIQEKYTGEELIGRYKAVCGLVSRAMGPFAQTEAKVCLEKKKGEDDVVLEGPSFLEQLSEYDSKKVEVFGMRLVNDTVRCDVHSGVYDDGMNANIPTLAMLPSYLGTSAVTTAFTAPVLGPLAVPVGIIAGLTAELACLLDGRRRQNVLGKNLPSGLVITLAPKKKTYDEKTAERYEALCEAIDRLNFRKPNKAYSLLEKKLIAIDSKTETQRTIEEGIRKMKSLQGKKAENPMKVFE